MFYLLSEKGLSSVRNEVTFFCVDPFSEEIELMESKEIVTKVVSLTGNAENRPSVSIPYL